MTSRCSSLLAALLSASVSLGGCAAIPGAGPAPPDTYDLAAAASPKQARRTTARQILVPEPSALKVMDSQNIVVRPSAGAISYLEGAQWADKLPSVVQARLIESFQRTGRIDGVGRPGEGLAIDYQIITDIRSFEIDATGPGERARVALSVKMLNDRNGVVRRARVFEATADVRGTGNDAYVTALDLAFREVAGDIVAWTLRAI